MTFGDSIRIEAPIDDVFHRTQDYSSRLAWDPFLKRAELLHEATQAAVGVQALCTAKSGFEMTTQYVSFRPPYVAAVRMIQGPWFFESFAGTWRLESLGDATIVHFKYHLRTRPRLLRPLLDRLARWLFARDTSRRLQALKRSFEDSLRSSKLPRG
jgi:hypothetical protein